MSFINYKQSTSRWCLVTSFHSSKVTFESLKNNFVYGWIDEIDKNNTRYMKNMHNLKKDLGLKGLTSKRVW